MKTSILQWILLPAIAAALLGCIRDVNSVCTKESGEAASLTLMLEMPGDFISSRAVPHVADDWRISEVDILVFKDEGAQETFLYRASCNSGDFDGTTTDATTLRKFQVQLPLSGDSHVRIVVLTNARSAINNVASQFAVGMVKEELLKLIRVNPNIGSFSMWGETKNTHMIYKAMSPLSLGTIRMLRSWARISLSISMPSFPGKDYGVFHTTRFSIYNTASQSYVAPDKANLNPDNSGQVSLPTAVRDAQNKLVLRSTPIQAAGGLPFYNPTLGIITALGETDHRNQTDDAKRPYIIVEGYYSTTDVRNNTTPSYYRIDFYDRNVGDNESPYDKRLDILRNHYYSVAVTSVDGPGYATEEEAVNSRPIHMNAEVIDWGEEWVDPEIDGQHNLTVSSDYFRVWANPEPVKLTITTDYPQGWSIVADPEYPAGFSSLGFSPDRSTTPGVREVTITVPSITPSADPGADDAIYYFCVKAGNLKKRIRIVQTPSNEISLDVYPTTLTFYKSARAGKTIEIFANPASAPRYFSYVGNISSWAYFPADGQALPTEAFQPTVNNTGAERNSVVTVYISVNGRIAQKTVNVKQLAVDPRFELVPENDPIPARTSATQYLVGYSELPWVVASVTDPYNLLASGWNNNLQAAGDARFAFNITNAMMPVYYTDKSATFHISSPRIDFVPADVTITRQGVAPWMKLNGDAEATNVVYQTDDITTPLSISTNAVWNYSVDANFSKYFSGITLGGSPATPGTLYATAVTAGALIPFNVDLRMATAAPAFPASAPDATTPAAGTPVSSVMTLNTRVTEPGAVNLTRTITLQRTMPALLQFISCTGTPAGEGFTADVTVNTNAPWAIKVYDTGYNEISFASQGTYGSWSQKNMSVNIPANNSWYSRTVIIGIDYGVGTPQTKIIEVARFTQPAGYYVTMTLEGVTDNTIPFMGGTFTVVATGRFPAMTIYLHPFGASASLLASDGSGKATTSVSIPRFNDPGYDFTPGVDRTGMYFYHTQPNHTMIPPYFAQESHYKLTTGRYVAIADYGSRVSWAAAMGLSTSYNSTEWMGNPLTHDPRIVGTGCGAYSESSQATGTVWRVPTPDEANQMLNVRVPLGGFVTSGNVGYWTTEQGANGVPDTWATYINFTTAGNVNGFKTTLWQVRCVK